jgi:hypothetical protein
LCMPNYSIRELLVPKVHKGELIWHLRVINILDVLY